jgi:hypothetical protein
MLNSFLLSMLNQELNTLCKRSWMAYYAKSGRFCPRNCVTLPITLILFFIERLPFVHCWSVDIGIKRVVEFEGIVQVTIWISAWYDVSLFMMWVLTADSSVTFNLVTIFGKKFMHCEIIKQPKIRSL